MSFRPIYRDHAISNIVFEVTLNRSFSKEELEKLTKSYQEWKDELPKTEEIQEAGYSPTEIGPYKRVGLQFTSRKRDGTVDYGLKVLEKTISVICCTYTRWDPVWKTCKKFLGYAISNVNTNAIVKRAAMRTVDLFKWDGPIEKASYDKLFQPNRYIPENVKQGSLLWHSDHGWYSEYKLESQDSFSNRIQTKMAIKQSHLIAQIDISLIENFGNSIQALSWFHGNVDQTTCEQSFTKMHIRNKELLFSLITPEMAKKISLNVE